MSQDRVAQRGIRQSCYHRNLHQSQDLACADTKTSEAKDAIAIGLNQGFQKSSCFSQRARAHYGFHWNLKQPIGNALCFRFLFTQAHAGKFRIRKKTKWNQSSGRHAFTASDAVVDHAEIVNANVGKLRAACYLADRPNPRRCGLQPLIHFDVSPIGQFDAG